MKETSRSACMRGWGEGRVHTQCGVDGGIGEEPREEGGNEYYNYIVCFNLLKSL